MSARCISAPHRPCLPTARCRRLKVQQCLPHPQVRGGWPSAGNGADEPVTATACWELACRRHAAGQPCPTRARRMWPGPIPKECVSPGPEATRFLQVLTMRRRGCGFAVGPGARIGHAASMAPCKARSKGCALLPGCGMRVRRPGRAGGSAAAPPSLRSESDHQSRRVESAPTDKHQIVHAAPNP